MLIILFNGHREPPGYNSSLGVMKHPEVLYDLIFECQYKGKFISNRAKLSPFRIFIKPKR